LHTDDTLVDGHSAPSIGGKFSSTPCCARGRI
jgi:hypothetical protein